MSYQALAQSEAEEGLGSLPPRYSGEAVIAVNPGTISDNSTGRASNYLHISDGKSITGTHHINTDLLPLAGRFDNAEDREKTPNVFLAAKYIDVELILSGSKKAKIVVSDPPHLPGHNREYSRHIIRITQGGRDASIAKHGLTLFDLEVDQYSHGRAVVSVEPHAFTGFVNGSFNLSEEMKNIAACVVARPGNSRWLVSPTGNIPQAQIEATSEPTAGTSESNSEDTTLVSNLKATCSGILFKNGEKESDGADTAERRAVCYNSEYDATRAELFAKERHYVRIWQALVAAWLVVLAGMIAVGTHAPYGENGEMYGGFIAGLIVSGFFEGGFALFLLLAPIV